MHTIKSVPIQIKVGISIFPKEWNDLDGTWSNLKLTIMVFKFHCKSFFN